MQSLIDELKKVEYTSLSDQAAASAINARTVVVRSLVDLWQLEEYARRNGIRVALEDAKADHNNQCRAIAINILAYLTSPRTQKLDVDLQEAREMFFAMVQCGFASQQQVDEMIALGSETVLWVDHHKIGNQSADSIRLAREIISGLRQRKDNLLQAGSLRWNDYVQSVDSLTLEDPDPEL